MEAMVMKKNNSSVYQDAKARGNIYRFISSIYLGPPSRDFVKRIADRTFLEELSMIFGDMGMAELRECAASVHPDQELASLTQEYMDLFAVPTGRYTTPFEDVYRGVTADGTQERGPLLGEKAIAVTRIYREAGAEMDRVCKELPTHIGVELSFMSFLCEREAAEVRKEGKKGLSVQGKTRLKNSAQYRELQKKFLQDHLNQWFPQLNRSIQANARSPFYRGMALITETFLAHDTVSLSGEPDAPIG